MPNPGRDARREYRVVYWGPEGGDTAGSLETIAESCSRAERGELRRIRTRLDPTLCYEELSLHLEEAEVDGKDVRLIAVPNSPELSAIRLQLLDRADAIVLVIREDEHRRRANLASVDELRSALAAYGRDLRDLPLSVQYAPAGASDAAGPGKLIAGLRISPVEIHSSTESRPAPFRSVLVALLRALQETAPGSRNPTGPEPDRFGLDPEDDPWLATPDPDLPSADSDISTLLEASMLADDGLDPLVLTADEDPFGPIPTASENAPPAGLAANPAPNHAIAGIGLAERSGKRGVKIPLVLAGPSGETVPLALHIELEVPGEED